jgi:hypothetical protein
MYHLHAQVSNSAARNEHLAKVYSELRESGELDDIARALQSAVQPTVVRSSSGLAQKYVSQAEFIRAFYAHTYEQIQWAFTK